jgi:preprotein translocase subunit SecG
MGVRKTTDFLEKATWGLAGFIMIMSIVCVMIRPKAGVAKPEIGIEATTPTEAPDMSTTLPTQAPTTTPPTE